MYVIPQVDFYINFEKLQSQTEFKTVKYWWDSHFKKGDISFYALRSFILFGAAELGVTPCQNTSRWRLFSLSACWSSYWAETLEKRTVKTPLRFRSVTWMCRVICRHTEGSEEEPQTEVSVQTEWNPLYSSFSFRSGCFKRTIFSGRGQRNVCFD